MSTEQLQSLDLQESVTGFLTQREAADLIGVDYSTIYALIERGKLEPAKVEKQDWHGKEISRRWFKRDDVLAAKAAVGPAPGGRPRTTGASASGRLLTIEQIAKTKGCTAGHARDVLKAAGISGARHGRQMLFASAQLDALNFTPKFTISGRRRKSASNGAAPAPVAKAVNYFVAVEEMKAAITQVQLAIKPLGVTKIIVTPESFQVV